ncbi:sulfotransferase family protein [Actinomycetospora termitidis]|uniref:Sulfotransferase n=1 Tax=Actinomycetospora termitidis TaxID=3053470 RepID=A0ABT7MLB2_9PSEU|nr:sulfotransferase [Actinomycetospora sp. Odt1-22]MDL5160138.1 sulfotransferase [Actinomycetospora sp. Odt1-22]
MNADGTTDAPDDGPKVLYLVGWGRSGTTLMDNLLGAHPDVVTAGEVTQLWELGLLGRRRCGCGTPVPDCAFWAAVFDRAFGGPPPDPERMLALRHGPLAVLRTHALVEAVRRGDPPAGAAEYAGVLSRLYRAVADVAGARVVVDASKRPPDAVTTALADGVRPYLLHMVRDPRACAYSWQRVKADPSTARPEPMHRHGRLMNVGHWVSWNLLAERAARAYPPDRYLQLRYEDFMTAPRETVAQVFDLLGEPVPDGPFTDDRTVVLPGNHTIAGNPGRFRTGEITIGLDDEWRTAQRPLDRGVTTALSLPWLRHYGYPWRVPSGHHQHDHAA